MYMMQQTMLRTLLIAALGLGCTASVLSGTLTALGAGTV